MTDWDNAFTAEQAAAAHGVLRGALGLPPEQFGTEQFVGMISDEIEQLRAAGRTDRDITDLLSRTIGVKLSPDAISRFYATPEARGRPDVSRS